MRTELRLGVLSDTHGLLRPEALEALRGVSQILHAGDLGSVEILRRLQTIAPVVAVRGNVDTGPWAEELALTSSPLIHGTQFFLIHNIADLARNPAPPETKVIVYGHSHRPSMSEREGIVYLNPGSAGRRRFSLPVTLVLGRKHHDGWEFSFVGLAPPT